MSTFDFQHHIRLLCQLCRVRRSHHTFPDAWAPSFRTAVISSAVLASMFPFGSSARMTGASAPVFMRIAKLRNYQLNHTGMKKRTACKTILHNGITQKKQSSYLIFSQPLSSEPLINKLYSQKISYRFI